MKLRNSKARNALSVAIAIGMMGTASYVYAADAPTEVGKNQPTAGQTMADLQQKGTPTAGVKVDADIQVSEAERPALNLPSELKVQVNDFKITGQDLVPESQLQAMIADKKGQLLTFGDLQKIADQLTNYFKSKGYMVARAYLPAQKIANGVVEYSVVIGKFDGIKVQNHTSIHDSALQREIAFLQKGDYIKKQEIERAVWLLSDLSGADAKMTISPGSAPGTSNLVIDLNPHSGKNGTLYVDNYGNRSTGYNEFGITYDLLNLAHEGDHLAMNFVTTGQELNNGSMNYTIPVWRDGLTMNAGFSMLNYSLGDTYKSLDANGTARVYHVGWDYAIQRSQRHNLYAGLRYDYSKLQDKWDAFGLTYGDKHSHAAILSLYGDEQDRKGATSWRLDYKLGTLGFDNSTTYTYFGAANTQGPFSKINANIIRRQNLNNRLYLLLSARGQYSSKNLDSSERMSLGGISGVRAYPQGEASGDIGYFTRAELRWLLPLHQQDQTLQLATYLDHGAVRINKGGSTDTNYRKLQGTGIGLLWSRKDDWWVRADYAWRLGAQHPTSDTTFGNGHFWIQGGVYF